MLALTRFLTISLLVLTVGSVWAAPKHLITATQQLRAAGVNKMLFAEEHATNAKVRRTYANMYAKFNAGGVR